jgi:hypothetical protein
MKIHLSKEEIDLVEALKKVYNTHRGNRSYTHSDSKVAKLEMASKKLMLLIDELSKRYEKEFVAVVGKSSLLLYLKNDDGSFSAVNYCEI